MSLAGRASVADPTRRRAAPPATRRRLFDAVTGRSVPARVGAVTQGETGMNADYFRRLARYNAWANRRLYEACAALSEADYRAARPSFFGSIHATLNHILVGDRVWLARFIGGVSCIERLDEILYDDFPSLRAARAAEDARILTYTGNLDDAAIDQTLRYRNMAGEPQETPLRWTLAHFFNHQAHHRGQVHGLLSATPVAPPSLDLIYFVREDRDAA